MINRQLETIYILMKKGTVTAEELAEHFKVSTHTVCRDIDSLDIKMARYQIWNKTDSIITPSGAQFTAQEWADRYPWAKLPGVKMVITAPPINGGCAMEYGATVAHYKKLGAAITDGMTDQEVLAAIEDFEDNPPDPGPSVEERTAAALEFLALNSLPDEV